LVFQDNDQALSKRLFLIYDCSIDQQCPQKPGLKEILHVGTCLRGASIAEDACLQNFGHQEKWQERAERRRSRFFMCRMMAGAIEVAKHLVLGEVFGLTLRLSVEIRNSCISKGSRCLPYGRNNMARRGGLLC
jgi:hypothetical protein